MTIFTSTFVFFWEVDHEYLLVVRGHDTNKETAITMTERDALSLCVISSFATPPFVLPNNFVLEKSQ